MVRNAFTLIELIFAIVIIAIIVAGVPRIIAENSEHFDANLLQDGIFATSDIASKALSFQWDSNSLDPTEEDAYAKVLDYDGSGSERISDGGVVLPLRVGHIRQDKHRRFHNAVTAPASSDMGSVDSSISTYHDTYSVSVTMGYSAVETNDVFESTPSATASNVKMIVITATSTDLDIGQIVMRVYAANIGEIDYAKRTL